MAIAKELMYSYQLLAYESRTEVGLYGAKMVPIRYCERMISS